MNKTAHAGADAAPAVNERRKITPPAIDIDHLTRQTLGDEAIAREILGLFMLEVGAARQSIDGPSGERREVAHRLKGAARAIGAFALADTAAGFEESPERTELIDELLFRIGEVEDYVAGLSGK